MTSYARGPLFNASFIFLLNAHVKVAPFKETGAFMSDEHTYSEFPLVSQWASEGDGDLQRYYAYIKVEEET